MSGEVLLTGTMRCGYWKLVLGMLVEQAEEEEPEPEAEAEAEDEAEADAEAEAEAEALDGEVTVSVICEVNSEVIVEGPVLVAGEVTVLPEPLDVTVLPGAVSVTVIVLPEPVWVMVTVLPGPV